MVRQLKFPVLAAFLALSAQVNAFKYPDGCTRALFCEEDCEKYDKVASCTSTKNATNVDLWELIQSQPQFSTVASLLNSTGLYKNLTTPEKFTADLSNILMLYLPTNDAIDVVPHKTFEFLNSDSDVLKDVLLAHMTKYSAEELDYHPSLLEGESINGEVIFGQNPNKVELVKMDKCDGPAYLSQKALRIPQAINGVIIPIAGVLVPCKLRNGTDLALTPGGVPLNNGNADLAKYMDPIMYCSAPPKPKDPVYYTKTFDAGSTIETNLGNGAYKLPIQITELKVGSAFEQIGDIKTSGDKSIWICMDLKRADGVAETRCANVDGQRGELAFSKEDGEVKGVKVAFYSTCGGYSEWVEAKKGEEKKPENPDDTDGYNNYGCNWNKYSNRVFNVNVQNITTLMAAGGQEQVVGNIAWDLKPDTNKDYPVNTITTLTCMGWTDEKEKKAKSFCKSVPDSAKGNYQAAIEIPNDSVKIWAGVRPIDGCAVQVYSKPVSIPKPE
eukprot:comp21818_c0_seq1/m.31086 comp21818_c0_seq1/g.31086  ORF comp21818_c0_seq1/g.31086 comp21818_c0_seq1/m.31086 type:complete len:499 (-) comp21818_c0_seq1:579-2075(-)